MQTQGISMVTSDLKSQYSTKATKADKGLFDSMMSGKNYGAKNSIRDAMDAVRPVGVKGKPMGDKIRKSVDSDKKDHVKSGKKEASSSQIKRETRAEVVVTVVMVVFQTNFQMSAEDVEDLMNQAGIALEDFAQTIQDGLLNGEGMDMLQNLVMKFHGITDKATILTEDSLTDKIHSIADQISEMLSDSTQVPDAAEQMSEGEESVTNLNVIMEKQNESESGAGTEQGSEMGTDVLSRRERQDVRSGEPAINTQFVDQLSQAYGQGDAEEVSSARQTMTRIVEQVVSQVRIRVMSSTTSMELQLHPASLGRVNLQVATSAGVSTAILTVETQAAKEALESQLITLKQTFEEQGLKVNDVEVNVSEFGLGEHNREEEQQGQQGSGGRSRRFRFDSDETESISVEEQRETEAERRDVNSVVDYTA